MCKETFLTFEEIQPLINRKAYLGANMPTCPRCGHEQVQLVAAHVVPSNWKCRICKHKFLYEPAP